MAKCIEDNKSSIRPTFAIIWLGHSMPEDTADGGRFDRVEHLVFATL